MKRADAIVFLGPSLAAREATRLFPKAIVRAPARKGDVLRALRDRPRVIVLIDGVFESQPSVWHQELRVALAEGVVVFGASSMGALRAVELAPFGMVGIGRVFEAYRDGLLVDDADVALLHADAEHEFRPLTLPFVNVVATCESALAARVMSRVDARSLLDAARELHYQDRHWPRVLDGAGWSAEKREKFERWRRAHPVDVKADDARACLVEARKALQSSPRGTSRPLETLSVWTRRAWLAEQGEVPDTDPRDGLRALLLAEWCRSLGLVPDPSRVAHFTKRARGLALDAGLARSFAEALALEELVLSRPDLVLPQAPSSEEGAWVAAMRKSEK